MQLGTWCRHVWPKIRGSRRTPSGKKIEAPWPTRTQGVLPSKYVLSLTMYGRWLLCHGLFFVAFLNSHEAFAFGLRHRDMYLGHPQKKPVPNIEQKNLKDT